MTYQDREVTLVTPHSGNPGYTWVRDNKTGELLVMSVKELTAATIKSLNNR